MNRPAADDLSSVYELAEKGLFSRAAEKIDRLQHVPIGLRVLRAELDAQLGSIRSARSRAATLLEERLSDKDRADCWAVIGRSALLEGEVQAGLRAMGLALDAAKATREAVVEARVRSRYVQALLHSVGVEAASVELPGLRRLARRAGDPKSLVVAHLLAAEISVRRGRHSSAATHLDTVRGLLRAFDNEWLRGWLATTSGINSMILSDYSGALADFESAHSSALLSGSRSLLIAALGNLGNLRLFQGEFEEAELLLDRLRAAVHDGNTVTSVNVLANSVELALAKRDVSAARRIDAAIVSLVSDLEGGSIYPLYYSVTRAKLAFLEGDTETGVSQVLSALPQIARRADIELLSRAKLVAADGLSRLGRAQEGAELMREAVADYPDCPIEIIAEAFRVAGRLAAVEDAHAARRYFSQAGRILRTIGNHTASEQVRRDSEDALASDHVENTRQVSEPVSIESMHDCERILALLQLGTNVPLLAQELLSWAVSSGAFRAGAISETDRSGAQRLIRRYGYGEPDSAPHDETSLERIPIGSFRHNSYALHLLPESTVAARCALISVQRLTQAAVTLAGARQPEHDVDSAWPPESSELQLGLICASDRTKDLIATVRQVADSSVTVLLTGETGVGKELFARALHSSSSRSDRTFLAFNCSTVPRDMFDSQLFGHKRGSFTGAIGDSAGVIRAAAGGTLFLDEIGEMAIETQPKLLRFLESGEIMPLGDTRPQTVDVRIVAATNANLDQLVSDGRFREDLYYRLNVIRINIPPLRERREEIPALVEHFLDEFGSELHKPLLRIADETLEYLVLHRWPGNVRQLANEIRRLVAMAEPGSVIMPAHLSDDIVRSRRTLPTHGSARLHDEVITRIDQPLSAALEHVERAAIQRALSMTDGHLDEAARMLGLSRKGLYLKRRRLNLG